MEIGLIDPNGNRANQSKWKQGKSGKSIQMETGRMIKLAKFEKPSNISTLTISAVFWPSALLCWYCLRANKQANKRVQPKQLASFCQIWPRTGALEAT
jgi:hypothetical protein